MRTSGARGQSPHNSLVRTLLCSTSPSPPATSARRRRDYSPGRSADMRLVKALLVCGVAVLALAQQPIGIGPDTGAGYAPGLVKYLDWYTGSAIDRKSTRLNSSHLGI